MNWSQPVMEVSPVVMLALDWAVRCFGHRHVYNRKVRSLRLAEEAVELVQAADVPKAKMLELVELVYSRPVGEFDQELGGVAMTHAVLCAVTGRDPHDYLMTELRRVLAKPPEHFTQRNQEKVALGMDGE